jgi:hypothetical protein
LEIVVVDSPNDVEISILEVNRVLYKMPSWDQLLDVLNLSLQEGAAEEGEKVRIIKAIKGRLDTHLDTELQGEAFKVYNQFKILLAAVEPTAKKQLKQPGGVLSSINFHAEALTAAFSLYPDKVQEWAQSSSEDAESEHVRKMCEVATPPSVLLQSTKNFLEYEDKLHCSFKTVLPRVLGSPGYSPVNQQRGRRGDSQSLFLDPWASLNNLFHSVAPDTSSGHQRGNAQALSMLPLLQGVTSGEASENP